MQKKIFSPSEPIIESVTTNGWIKTCRNQKDMIFIQLSDGTCQKSIQVVVCCDQMKDLTQLSGLTTGSSISVTGSIVKSPAKGQTIELSATDVKVYQICPQDFPFQKVGLELEFMRRFPSLRHRTNVIRAVFSAKSMIMKRINDYFMSNDYTQIDLPVLTTNACEGGCQPLQVTSLFKSDVVKDIPTDKTGKIDFTKDFFGNPVFLTVSNQLHLECFAHGMGRVFTITPATRGEPSQSTKHLAYFNMLEWEFCFGDLDENIRTAEECIKFCASGLLENCKSELEVLDFSSNKKLLPKIKKNVSEPFVRIEHYDAVQLLKEAHVKIPFRDEPDFAGDLSGEHERWLVQHFASPVVVMRYPKNVKAFYMPVSKTREIDGQKIEYVECFDLLMDIGEVVGGSQRIWDEAELVSRMKEQSIDTKHLSWYVDLRRFGSVPHGGAGLGIERLVAVLTGMEKCKRLYLFSNHRTSLHILKCKF